MGVVLHPFYCRLSRLTRMAAEELTVVAVLVFRVGRLGERSAAPRARVGLLPLLLSLPYESA